MSTILPLVSAKSSYTVNSSRLSGYEKLDRVLQHITPQEHQRIVIRVECRTLPLLGRRETGRFETNWCDLPCPNKDTPPIRIKSIHNCGTLPHQFPIWWSEKVLTEAFPKHSRVAIYLAHRGYFLQKQVVFDIESSTRVASIIAGRIYRFV